MKVLHRVDGLPNNMINLSEIKETHLKVDSTISFNNFNNMNVICYKDPKRYYVLECQNGIKNFKVSLKEVKKYIKENIMK